MQYNTKCMVELNKLVNSLKTVWKFLMISVYKTNVALKGQHILN